MPGISLRAFYNCTQNNSAAIFFARTDHPDLIMRVIPIGKIRDKLSLFQTMAPSIDMKFQAVK